MSEDIKVTLWKSADKLRTKMDAAEYEHIVLGSIFLKYISDPFTAQQDKIREMVSDPTRITSSVKTHLNTTLNWKNAITTHRTICSECRNNLVGKLFVPKQNNLTLVHS